MRASSPSSYSQAHRHHLHDIQGQLPPHPTASHTFIHYPFMLSEFTGAPYHDIIPPTPGHSSLLHHPSSFEQEPLEDPVQHLPIELSMHIFSFLTDKELCYASRVSRDWYHVANDDQLWRARYLKRWPSPNKEKIHDEEDMERGHGESIESKGKEYHDEGAEAGQTHILIQSQIAGIGAGGGLVNNAGGTNDGNGVGTSHSESVNDGNALLSDLYDEEDKAREREIARLVVPSTLSVYSEWKQRYINKHMEPQIRLLKILSENTSLQRLVDKQSFKKIENTILNPNQALQERLKRYPHLQRAFEGKKSLVETKLIFIRHVSSLASLLLGLVIWLCVEFVNPDFFDFPYLYIPFHFGNLWNFWPLFVYAGVLCLLKAWMLPSTAWVEQEIFLWRTGNSILAGIFEECGFRFLYICSAMLTLVIGDWVIKLVLMGCGMAVLYMGAVAFLRMIACQTPFSLRELVAAVALILSGYGLFQFGYHYFLLQLGYEYVMLPLTNLLTLGKFQSIFYEAKHPKLLVFGMISANSGFRDAHKYEGWLGRGNAWIIGFIMMSATLNYGLLTAIVLHALYDLEFACLSFLLGTARKCVGGPEPVLPIYIQA